MRADVICPPEHVAQLGDELAGHHGDSVFRSCTSMGEVMDMHLRRRLELDRANA
jgi:hypothetical protein